MLLLSFLLLGWFTANSLSNIALKATLGLHADPLLLTAVALAIAGAWSMIKVVPRLVKTPDTILTLTLPAVLHMSNTLLTFCSLSLGTVGTTYMIKAAEPIVTLLLSRFLLGTRESAATHASLFLLFIGVVLIAQGVTAAALVRSSMTISVAAAAFSNVASASRNVLFKGDLKALPFTPLEQFSILSGIGLLTVLPIALISRGFVTPGFDVTLREYVVSATPGAMLHCLYNAFSFLVLEQVSAVNHALILVVKRIFLVLTDTVYNGTIASTTWTSALGFFTANCGLVAYVFTRNLESGHKVLPLAKSVKIFTTAVVLLTTISLFVLVMQPTKSGPSSNMNRTILCELFSVRVDPSANFSEALKQSGANFGNLVWAEGTRRLYDMGGVEVVSYRNVTRCDVALLSVANILKNSSVYTDRLESSDFGTWILGMATFIRSFPKAVLAVGLGTNGFFRPTAYNSPFYFPDIGHGLLDIQPEKENFPPFIREFLASLELKSNFFFVRGKYTERACHHQGFKKALSVGCPSLFLNPERNLGQVIGLNTKKLALLPRHSLKFALLLPPSFITNGVKLLLRILEEFPESVVVIQDPRDFKTIAQAVQKLSPSEGVLALLMQRQVYFTSYDAWHTYVCKLHAVIGFRIHGSMVGVSCGLPILLIAPDVRVYELATAMALPVATPFEPALSLKPFDPVAYMMKQSFNATAFDLRRKDIANIYVREFSRAGLPVSKELLRLAKGSLTDVDL